MKLYDRACFKCGYLEVDVVATQSADLRGPCPRCSGRLEWKPSFGKVDGARSFYDPHMGKTYNSFGAMERDAESKGFAVLPRQEFEANLSMRDKTEERLSRGDKKLDEAISKTLYRLTHGYKDA